MVLKTALAHRGECYLPLLQLPDIVAVNSFSRTDALGQQFTIQQFTLNGDRRWGFIFANRAVI